MPRIPVAIVGATGYTGAELVRLLLQHPHVELVALAGRSRAGERFDDVFPSFKGVLDQLVEPFDADRLAERAKLVFCALPHGQSIPTVGALVDRGVDVIDLSADYRLRDALTYQQWYGIEHSRPELLARAVYGLPERHHRAIPEAKLIAAPGCYPTASILALGPLLDRGLVEPDGLIIDAKSGVSGAGRGASQSSLYCEAAEGVHPYNVAGRHRHTPEIEQELLARAPASARLLFTPHLVPMIRGMLATCYARPTDSGLPATAYVEALRDAYRRAPLVTVLDGESPPDTAHVRGSNRAHVTAVVDPRTGWVLAIAAIDNLGKGASGQAVQCMNLRLELPETSGLESTALFP
jgi:N-acetyl-gamma-glutamyl-phosphate reductase